MATFDNKKLINESPTNPILNTYTVWALWNIIIFHITTDGWPRTWWTPSFNGELLTQAGTAQYSWNEWYAEIRYLLNPATWWTRLVSVPNTGTDPVQIAISSYISSTWNFAFDVTNQTSAISTNPTVSLTPSTTTGFIVDSLFTGYRNATTGNNRTILYNNDTGSEGNACQYYLNPPTSSVAMSYTQSSDDWGIIAVAFKEIAWPPSVLLNTPDLTAFWTNQPTLEYTWTDGDGEDIRYNIEIDSVNTFDSWLIIDDSYSESNSDASIALWQISQPYEVWQTFTSQGWILDFVKFYLSRTSWQTTWATAKIYEHTWTYGVDGKPWILLATSDSVAYTEIPLTADLVTFNFSWLDRITLNNGSYYVVTCTSSASDLGEQVYIYYDSSSPTHSGNFVSIQTSWLSSSASDVCFYVYTSKPLLDKTSWTDLWFANVDTPADTDPFNSWDKCDYDVQLLDALDDWTYYWRVRWIDPSGSNIYGDWSDIYSFSISIVSAITNIKLWSNTTNKIYIWSTEVLKSYLWSTIVYDKT